MVQGIFEMFMLYVVLVTMMTTISIIFALGMRRKGETLRKDGESGAKFLLRAWLIGFFAPAILLRDFVKWLITTPDT